MANTTDYSTGYKVLGRCYSYEEIRVVFAVQSNVDYINYIIGLVVNIFLTVSTIFLNSVTILAYVKSAFLKSKKAYFLIMLLSVNDLLVGLFANGSFVVLLITTIIGYSKCETYILFYYKCNFLAAMSIITLFGLNIERYLSIVHPFYHRTKVTKSKLLKMVVGFWVLGITLPLSSSIFGEIMKMLSSILFQLIAFSTLYIYAAIFMTARKKPRLTETRETEEHITEARIQEERTNKKEQLQNIKMAKFCAIVVGLVFTFNIPMAVTRFLSDSNFVTLLSLWSGTIVLSSSSINSLVFFWKNLVLRKEAKQLFKNLTH